MFFCLLQLIRNREGTDDSNSKNMGKLMGSKEARNFPADYSNEMMPEIKVKQAELLEAKFNLRLVFGLTTNEISFKVKLKHFY